MAEDFNVALARVTAAMQPITKMVPRFRGCLYGPTGVGKTVEAQEIMQRIVAPGKGILYIDTSEGWVSLMEHPHLTARTQAIPFTTIEDIRVIGRAIKNKIGIWQYIGGVILDEGSSMAQIDTDRLFEARKNAAAHNKPVTDDTPAWPDYHAALARFRAMNAELFDIPGLHVIILAHVSDKKNERGEIINLYPSFSPKIAAKVKEPLHLVGYMTAENKVDPSTTEPGYVRMVQVNPTKMVDAKTRIRIPSYKVPAESLPGIIAEWLAKGAPEVPAQDVPVEDPQENPLAGMTPEEALDKVDEASDGGALSGQPPAENDDDDVSSILAPLS